MMNRGEAIVSAGIVASLVLALWVPGVVCAQSVAAGPQGQAALDKASKANRYLFVFFYKQGGGLSALLGRDNNARTNSLATVFTSAMERLSTRADYVSVNIGDPHEKEFVKKFDASRSPVPLVLAIAPSGVVTRGFPGKFTEEELVEAIVSPATEKCLKTLQGRKLVLLCFQNSGTSSNEAAMKGVKEFKADPKFGQATEIITVDPADPTEEKLVREFKVDPHTKEAVTVFLAPPGMNLATYKGATSKETMVAKLSSSVAGCGPGGCGPGGCGPATQAVAR